MFGYTLKKSDYIALTLVLLLSITIYFASNTQLPYTWKWHVVLNYFFYQDDMGQWHINLLTKGILNTIRLTVYTTMVALPLALLLAFARLSKNQVVSTVAMLYINFVRNVPVLVFLFIFYFFVSEQIFPKLGLNRGLFSDTGISYILFGDTMVAPNLVAGFICLGLFESAFFAEIIRGAIQSIPSGQREASRALGVSRFKTMRLVILPQAFRKSYPALAGQCIIVLKNTSIASIVSVHDLMFSATEIVVATRRIFEVWIIIGILYFIMCYGLQLLFKHWEHKAKLAY